MTDPGKTISRTSLETLHEHGENDDIAGGAAGNVSETPSCPRHLPGSVPGKLTMESSSSTDASDRDSANRRSFHAQLSRSFFQSRSLSSSSVDGGSPSPSKNRLGTLPVEDPITHENVVNSKVLLLYTGGALGWKVDPDLEGIFYFILVKITTILRPPIFRGEAAGGIIGVRGGTKMEVWVG